MKTIIVPTDYSASALHTAQYAAALAQHFSAKLILYHAFYLPVPVSEAPVSLPSLEELTAEHLKRLEEMQQKIGKNYPVRIECYASPMSISEELPKLVKQQAADLVVMGMRSLNAFDRKVFGSTPTQIIRESAFPVLVVPEEAEYKAPAHILFACHYEALSRKTKLTLLQELATAFHADIQVLHVELPVPATGRDPHRTTRPPNLEELLQGVKHQYEFLEAEDVLKGIEEGIRENHSDLLVMVLRPHGFWDRVLGRSNTEQMAFQTPIPLLVLPVA